MAACSKNISAVFLKGLRYENDLNVLLSPPSELRGDVRSLAGNLGFDAKDINYISEKKYPFVYMLDQWIKRVGAEDATLKSLLDNLIALERPDAAEVIGIAIKDLEQQDLEQLNTVAKRHNGKLKRSESNASLCPFFPHQDLVVDLPLENSIVKKDKKISLDKLKPFKNPVKDVTDVPSVFIVYVTEDTDELKLIRKLVEKLRKSRVDAKADMFESIELSQHQGYYIYSNLIEAEYVLLICTASFEKKNEDSDEGRKATYILKLMLDFIYEHGPFNSKYIPILLPNSNREHIPYVLRACKVYDMSRKDFHDDLLRRIFKIEKYKLVPLPEKRPVFEPIVIGPSGTSTIKK